MGRGVVMLGALIGLAMATAGCSGSSSAASGSPLATLPRARTTTARSTFPPPSTTFPQPKTYIGLPCTSSQLSVTLGGYAEVAGTYGGLLVFTNHGSRVCTLTGYPTVVAEDAQGQVLMTAKHTTNSQVGSVTGVPAPQAFVLPGLSASAVIAGIGVPNTHYSCVTVATLVVTPPGATGSVSLSNAFPTGHGVPGCGPIAVHPVIPGLHYSDTSSGVTSLGFHAP